MGGDWARSHDPISSLNETETYAVPKVSPIPTNREEGTMNEQIKILEEIQKKGFNAITCSLCGEVNLVRDLPKLMARPFAPCKLRINQRNSNTMTVQIYSFKERQKKRGFKRGKWGLSTF